MERKLVTIRKIAELNPIPDADAIEVATVDGWKLVVKKGEFAVGDNCVYFEIDSFLPESDPRYAFLMKSGVREFEGVRGHKLRTIKLRGQISQGLALPLGTPENTIFPEVWQQLWDRNMNDTNPYLDDFAGALGIKKWEASIPAELQGQIKGVFPSFIQKTDQERCQNIVKEIFSDLDARYEVSIKLDGTSVTYYFNAGEVGACSRNLELKINAENGSNTLIKMLTESGLIHELIEFGHPLAIQGELMGPGIQKNREQLKTPKFFIFEMQAIDAGIKLQPTERMRVYSKLMDGLNPNMVAHAPIIHADISLRELGITNVDELLAYAEGPSINNPVREGLVFKRLDGQFSFKAISNAYLAKEKD